MDPVSRTRCDPAQPGRRPARRLLPPPAAPRMRVLSVLSSTNPMGSEIGRATFELAARLAERVAYEFSIDDRRPDNVALVRAFAARHAIPVHVGPALVQAEALDSFPATLPGLIRQDRWDVIESVGWSNTFTNDLVLREIGDRALVYTPHYRPTWTAPALLAMAGHVEDVHRRMTQRADAVLCLSPRERRILQSFAPGRNHGHVIPIGLDFAATEPGSLDRPPQLLFAGNPGDPLHRFDQVMALLPRLLHHRPDLKLVILGDAPHGLIPEPLRPSCEPRGAVGVDERRRAFAESRGVVVPSAYDSSGLTILEALAAGTPAFAADLDTTRGLFAGHAGINFCPGDDPEATAAIVLDAIARGVAPIRAALADRDRLAAAFDWDGLAARKWEAMASAWFTRHYIDHPFRGPAVSRATSLASG